MSFSHQLDHQLDSSPLSSHSSFANSPFLSNSRGLRSPTYADPTSFPARAQTQSKRSIQLPFLRPSQHSSHFLLGINTNKYDYPEPVSSSFSEKVPETIASPFPLNHLSFKGEGHKRRIGFYTPDLYHKNQQLEDRIASSSEIDAQEDSEQEKSEISTPRIPMAHADIELIISQIKDLSSIAKKTMQKKREKSRHNSLEIQGNSLEQMVELPLEFLNNNKNDNSPSKRKVLTLNDSSESINSFIEKKFPLKLAYRRRSCHCTWCGDLPPKQRDIENNPWVSLLAEWAQFTKPKEVPKIEVREDSENMSSKRGSKRVSGFTSPSNLKRPSLYKGRTSGRLISGNSSPLMIKSSNGVTPTLKEERQSKIEIIEEDEPVVRITTRRNIKRFQTEVYPKGMVNSPMNNKHTMSSLQISKVPSLDIKPDQNIHQGGKSFTFLAGTGTNNKLSEFGKLNTFLNGSLMKIDTENNNSRPGSIMNLNLKRKTVTPTQTNIFYRPENKRTSGAGQSKTIILSKRNLSRPSFIQENSQQSRIMNKTTELEAGKGKKSVKLVRIGETLEKNMGPEKKALKRILGKMPIKLDRKEREASVEKRKIEQKQKEKEKKDAIEKIETQKHTDFLDIGVKREKIVKAYKTPSMTGRSTPKLKILPRLVTETAGGAGDTQMYTEEDVIRVTSPSEKILLLEEAKLKELRERYKTNPNNLRSPSRGNVSVNNVVLIHKNLVEGGGQRGDKGKIKG